MRFLLGVGLGAALLGLAEIYVSAFVMVCTGPSCSYVTVEPYYSIGFALLLDGLVMMAADVLSGLSLRRRKVNSGTSRHDFTKMNQRQAFIFSVPDWVVVSHGQ